MNKLNFKGIISKVFSALIGAFLVVLMIFSSISSTKASATYIVQGDGTSENPYIIETDNGLKEFRDIVNGINNKSRNSNACAILNYNINLNYHDWSSNDSWTPIGTNSHPYNGTFDGNGYTISRLNVYKADAASLFGYVSGTVKDLTVEGNVRGDGILGGIVGELRSGGVVLNCVNHATVINENPNTIGYHDSIPYIPYGAGGIVGYNNGGTISNCKNTGTVGVKMNSSGGIASINSGIIDNCYNIGYVGGVEPISTIKNSGTIGGIVGELYEGGSISNSFNYGEISTTYNAQEIVHSGGLVGNREINTTITNSYCLNNVSKTVGAGDSYEDHILTADEFKDSTKFINWNFNNTVDGVWKMGKKYPVLKDELLLVGEGTLASPYQIGTRAEFIKFSDIVNGIRGEDQNLGACATLTSNINLAINNYAEDWMPIAKDDSDNPISYSGTFNGNNKIISGFFVQAGYEPSDKTSIGLFANVSGTILNLAVNAVYIHGQEYSRGTGGIAGRLESGGQIINCYNYSEVRASNSENVGGIVGLNKGTVKQCKNCAKVTLSYDNYGGGIVGRNYGTITNCYNVSEVRLYGGCHYLGGIAGYAEEGSTISYTHNQGEVFGFYDGRPIYGDKADNNVTVISSYYLDTGSSMPEGYQAIQLSAEGFLQHMADDNGFTGWDFTNVWKDGESYPVLQNEIELIFINLEGSGTLENPYKIDDKDDLIEFCDIVNGTNGKSQDTNICAKLTSDISIDDIENWTPIGLSDSSAYNGTFDGDGHVIYGLNISNDTGHQGLFGAVGGTIKNLAISGNVKSNNASSDYGTGAIAGHLKTGGTITKCYNYATVYGRSNAGGIVGINNGTISICKNASKVTAIVECSGGIAGKNNGSIENCYNTGFIRTVMSGSQFAGGITGYTSEASTISNSHSQGEVRSYYFYGPAYGRKEAGATITSTYYKNDTNVTEDGGATGYTSAKFKFQSNFTGWNFNDSETGIWKMGSKYPILKNEIELVLNDYTTIIEGDIDGSNGTQKIFVDKEGKTHIIYDHNGKVYYTSTSNDGLYYSNPVVVAEGTGGEIELSNGRIFVSYLDSLNKPYIAYSDNGTSFTPVCLNNSVTVYSGPLHMATYYNNNVVYVYAIPSSGEYFFYSLNSGVSYNTIYSFNPSGYTPTNSDVLVDPNTGKVYVGKNDPENGLMLCESDNNGEDFTDPNLLTDSNNDPISVPNAVFGFGNSMPNNKPNIYIAGDSDNLYQVTPTSDSTNPYPSNQSKIDWPDDGKEGSRTIATDNNGNVVLGFTDSDDNTNYQPGFNDGSFTNFGKPSKLPEAEGGNFAINPNTGGLVYPTKDGDDGITLGEKDGVAYVDVPITGMEVSKATLIIPMGGSSKLDVKMTPSNSLDRSVEWSSSDTSIATVDPVTGVVTPVSPGEVIITASKTVELPNEQNVMYMSGCNVTIVESAPNFTNFGDPDLNGYINDGINGGYNVLDNTTPMLDDGWYVLEPDPESNTLTLDANLPIKGTVNLVIPESMTLVAPYGINVPEGATLNIFAEGTEDNAGKIIASSNNGNAAIGGLEGEDCGTINIHSGDIRTTNSGDGAGIGGGYLGNGGEINILGGKVTAETSGNGAAIGGGANGDGGNITIKGGEVETITSSDGAAIGGGVNGNGGSITINGGEPNAITFGNGAAIGGGANGNGGSITINGGEPNAISSGNGAAIGGGANGSGGTINIDGGMVKAVASDDGAAIGGGKLGSSGEIIITDGIVNAETTGDGAAIGGGNEGVGEFIYIEGGTINASSSGGGAAIGGGKNADSGSIFIAGGEINALNTSTGAAIGSGENVEGEVTGCIYILGGTTKAENTGTGAGIGGGSGSNGLEVNFASGLVTAIGGTNASSIGAGSGALNDGLLNVFASDFVIFGGDTSSERTFYESPYNTRPKYLHVKEVFIVDVTPDNCSTYYGESLETYPYKVSIGEVEVTNNSVLEVVASRVELVSDYTVGCDTGLYDIDIVDNGYNEAFMIDDLCYRIVYTSSKLTVNKATITMSKAPSAVSGLKYTGNDQYLVNEGIVNSGTVKYSLDGINYSLTIPTGLSVGSYNVYYYVEGNNNYLDLVDPSFVVVVQIAKAPLIIAANNKSTKYNEESPEFTITYSGFQNGETLDDLEGSLTFSCSYKKGDKAGNYAIIPGGFTSDRYVITYNVGILSVGKVDSVINITPKAVRNLVYDGESHEIITSGMSIDGQVYYKVGDGDWSTSIPVRTNAGEYEVYYKVVGDESHNDLALSSWHFTVTIEEASVTVTTVPEVATNLEYNGKPQELISVGSVEHGTIWYKINDGEYSTEVPKVTDAGTYTVYYKVIAEDNYADIAEQGFEVTIAELDKTDLIDEINKATDLYNDIKDEYPTVANLLGEVLDKANSVKNNPNVLGSEIIDAINQVEKGIDDAEAGVVSEKINAIGDVEYSEDSKALIDEARDAYNNLTPSQKENVKNSVLDKLIESEQDYSAVDDAVSKINAIEDVKYNNDSKALIDEANNAYNNLTDNQKSILPTDCKNTLDNANDDYNSVSEFVNSVNGISEVQYNDTYKSLIEEAKELYEALSQKQKDITPISSVKSLQESEKLYHIVDEFVKKVNAIGEIEYNLTSKDLIDEAEKALNSLTSEQLEIVPVEILNTLERAQEDFEKINAAVKEINKIKEVLYDSTSKELIDNANELYNALSDRLKSLIPVSVASKLENANNKYNAMESAVNKISSIGDVSYTVASHKAIEDAKKAYDSLTEEEKALIPSEEVEALNNAINEYSKKEDDCDRTNLKDEERNVTIEVKDNTPIPDDIVLIVDVRVEANIQLEELVETKPQEEIVLDHEEIAFVYDVKLVRTITDSLGNTIEEEIQPGDIKEGTIVIVKMAIPENIKGEDFKVLHIHSNEDIEYVEYEINGKEVLVHVDRLSKFAFVINKEDARKEAKFCLGWVSFIALIASIALIAVFFVLKTKLLYGYIGAALSGVSFILSLIEVCINGCAISIVVLILSLIVCGGCVALYFLDKKKIIQIHK